MTREPKEAIFSPSGADFEAFPPTIKRKYFSTLERLRYAQGQPSQEPTAMNIFRPRTGATPKPRTSHLRRPSLFQIRSSSRNANEQVPDSPGLPPTATIPVAHISQEAVDWYQNLPEKIKRSNFTSEERHALSRTERSVSNAHEQQLYQLGARANRSLPSLSSCSEPESAREEVLNTPMDMSDAVFEGFRFPDHHDNSADLGLDEYHNHVAETANVSKIISPSLNKPYRTLQTIAPASMSRNRPSLDRIRLSDTPSELSMTPQGPLFPHVAPLQIRPRASSKGTLPAVAFPRPDTPKRPTILERRSLKKARSHQNMPPMPHIDPEAAHVNDPATRMKLRLYLSSAAKFDEALEFGFPSLDPTTPSQLEVRDSYLTISSPQASHRRSMSTGALQSLHTVSRSVSTIRNTKRESTAIGTTFFYDDEDEHEDESEGEGEEEDEGMYEAAPSEVDTETARDSLSMHNAGMESDGTAVDIDFPEGIAELPADPIIPKTLPPLIIPQNRPAIDFTPISRVSTEPSPPHRKSQPRLSRSVSLRPRLDASMDPDQVTALPQVPQSAKEFTTLSGIRIKMPVECMRAAERVSPQTPLKPWIEPGDTSGEREMTLRLTLTRKDLRADESLIYPDGGSGSWTSPSAYSEHSHDPAMQGRWRFWSKRR